ncbi:hypothetical protein TRVL_08922 [Trypanosoma vivax]|nr:hypothetical protein TRVL_08922 [Trypanosoma vivax]
MATHRQHRRRQRPWRIYRLHQVPARRIRGRQLRPVLRPPTQQRVSKHLPTPANQRDTLPFVLALLNHPAQLRQLRGPKRRRHAIALGNCPLCGRPDASRHRLVQGVRALSRSLRSSEYELVTQCPKLVLPRLFPRVQWMGVFEGSNHVQAGAHERIERVPIVITVWTQWGLPDRGLALFAKRDAWWGQRFRFRWLHGG